MQLDVQYALRDLILGLLVVRQLTCETVGIFNLITIPFDTSIDICQPETISTLGVIDSLTTVSMIY